MCNRIGKVSRKQAFVYVLCTSESVEVKYRRISCSQGREDYGHNLLVHETEHYAHCYHSFTASSHVHPLL